MFHHYILEVQRFYLYLQKFHNIRSIWISKNREVVEELKSKELYCPLDLYMCLDCGHVQLLDIVP